MEEFLVHRGYSMILPFMVTLEDEMNAFQLGEDGPYFKSGPNVTARRHHGHDYVELNGGYITLRNIKILQDYMEDWVLDDLIQGLTFLDCKLTGLAATYYAEHFPYMNIRYIELINCECDEVEAVSVVNTDQHTYLNDSVCSLIITGDRDIWPTKALSSIATRFVEHNTKLRRLIISHTHTTTMPDSTRLLQALVDRCELLSPSLRSIKLQIDVGCKRHADLVRDILSHENSHLNTLYLGSESHHKVNLEIILSGIATNNGRLKKLYLHNGPWRVSDWEMLLRSLESNNNAEFQLTELHTGQLIGTPSNELITDLSKVFQRQSEIQLISTPDMEHLRFFALKGMVDRAMYLVSNYGDLDMSRAYKPFTDNFLQNHARLQRVLCEPADHWRQTFGDDEQANAERLSGIYHALRSGCGMHDWQALVNPHRVHPEEHTWNEPANKKRKLP